MNWKHWVDSQYRQIFPAGAMQRMVLIINVLDCWFSIKPGLAAHWPAVCFASFNSICTREALDMRVDAP
jgi:hypothetical protein